MRSYNLYNGENEKKYGFNWCITGDLHPSAFGILLILEGGRSQWFKIKCIDVNRAKTAKWPTQHPRNQIFTLGPGHRKLTNAPGSEACRCGVGSLHRDLYDESCYRENAKPDRFAGQRGWDGEEDAREEHENDEPLPIAEIGRCHGAAARDGGRSPEGSGGGRINAEWIPGPRIWFAETGGKERPRGARFVQRGREGGQTPRPLLVNATRPPSSITGHCEIR